MKTQIFTFCVAALSITTIAAQNIISVDNNSNTTADFTTVQAAVNAAADGDYIYIYPSDNLYDGAYTAVNVENKKLHFRGVAHHLEASSSINAAVNQISFKEGSSGSSVMGLRVGTINTNTSNSVKNILIQNNWIGSISAYTGSGVVGFDNWVIEGNIFNGGVTSGYSNNNWQIINNFFDLQISGGTVFSYLTSDTVLRNNTIKLGNVVSLYEWCANTAQNNIYLANTTSAYTIALYNSPTVTFSNCLTYNYGTGGSVNPLGGTNNYNNTNPSFATAPTPLTAFSVADDYHVTNTTLVGTDGTQIGIFGQNFPFNKFGYSFQMPYIESMQILNTTIPATGILNMNVKAKSN